MFRWTLAPAEAATLMQGKQDKKNNTYYNNMIMYINNKNGDNDSTMSAIKVSTNFSQLQFICNISGQTESCQE